MIATLRENITGILSALAFFLLFISNSKAEPDGLFPSPRKPFLYEIGEISFNGNATYSHGELLSIIESKSTERSFQHILMQYYYDQFILNKSTPKIILKSLEQALETMSNEIRFFDKSTAVRDVESIWHFYNMNGFHKVKVNYAFTPDSTKKRNKLTFTIEENVRNTLHAVKYFGLDSLPTEIISKVNGVRTLKTGDYFNEAAIAQEVNRVFSVLLNNGYFFAVYDKPLVTRDTILNRDSVTIEFFPGGRQKFGKIIFVDSTLGQHPISHGMQTLQIEFLTGEWFSREKVQRTMDNLLSLGVYDFVSVDTTDEGYTRLDSALNFRVFTQYRKLKEWNFGLFVNQTPIDNYTNAGLEGSVLSRNLFGDAQSGSLFGNIGLKNLSDLVSRRRLEYEFQLGFRFAQPLLWTLDNSKIGLNSSFIVSHRKMMQDFSLFSISWDIRFPIRLPNVTYFNSMSMDFGFERQNPVDFDVFLKNALSKSEQDSNRIREYYIMYTNLYLFLNDPNNFLTANLMGLSLTADHRNSPFSPTNGEYTYISLDGWNIFLSHPSLAGLAKYIRGQFIHYQFIPLNPRLVAALKGRIGYIHKSDDESSYIPLERQFFCGGANSVRGWSSRSLRYTNIKPDSTLSQSNYDFFSNFLGNRALIEGSIELRYRFDKIPGLNQTLAEQVANIGINIFLDFGNGFYWLLDNDTTPKATDFVTKLAYAGGLGLRYETPLGPVRLDFAWPLYDPMKTPNKKMQVHIGLGHAF